MAVDQSRDFAPYVGLESLDVKLLTVASFNVGAGAGAAATKPIPRQADGIMVLVSGAVAMSLEGGQIVANPTDGALSLQAGWSPMIQLELDSDLTPFFFNAGAGAVTVTLLVFTKRRKLARQRGQV